MVDINQTGSNQPPPAARRGRPVRRTARLLLDHPGLAAAAMAAVVLAFGVALPGILTYQNLRRVDEIDASITEATRIQDVTLRLQRSLIEDLGGELVANLLMVEALREAVAELAAREPSADPTTAAALQELDRLLARSGVLPRNVLVAGLGLIRQLMQEKVEAQRLLLARMQADARRQLRLIFGGLAALAALVLAAGLLLPTRVIRPLTSLRDLLSRLAEGEFATAPVEEAHPLILPLFHNYNYLVARLEELEVMNRERARGLEEDVGAATRALLEQHRTLANAERLAAAGATAAGVAHELRNPLAGVLMAVQNLQEDAADAEVGERLDLLRAELERVVELLNGYLTAARHRPESARTVELNALVTELLTLLRYQIPTNVALASDVAPGITSTLPRDRIRQALMNLVLNSVDALNEGGGTITVSAAFEDGGLRLSVMDDGPGIPRSMVQTSMQPFTSAKEAGAGLGLAMVRRTLDDLGGKLELENREPRGTAAHMWIPSDV